MKLTFGKALCMKHQGLEQPVVLEPGFSLSTQRVGAEVWVLVSLAGSCFGGCETLL